MSGYRVRSKRRARTAAIRLALRVGRIGRGGVTSFNAELKKVFWEVEPPGPGFTPNEKWEPRRRELFTGDSPFLRFLAKRAEIRVNARDPV